MIPFRQRKPLQILRVGVPGVKNGQHEKASPSGLSSAVSEIPTIRPLSFFTGHATALLVLAPPKLPRSIALERFTHNAACPTVSPLKLARPVAQSALLMLFAWPAVPPRVGSATTLYLVCETSWRG